MVLAHAIDAYLVVTESELLKVREVQEFRRYSSSQLVRTESQETQVFHVSDLRRDLACEFVVVHESATAKQNWLLLLNH